MQVDVLNFSLLPDSDLGKININKVSYLDCQTQLCLHSLFVFKHASKETGMTVNTPLSTPEISWIPPC